MAESPVNGVGTTLASSVTNSATTVSLTSATGFTNAQYHCLISDGTNYEIVLATALSGTTLTVTRAVEAYNGVTTAYSFASGSTINVVPTVASVVGLIEGQPYLTATGVGNATTATRYVGGTANGAPTSGTFAVGDFIIDQTGTIWVCTTAGTPGTWTTTISSHLSLRSASATVGRNEVTLFSGSTASQTLTAPSSPIDGSNWTVINKASVAVTLSFTPSMIALGSSSGVTTFSVPANGSFSFVNYNGSQWYMVASNSATQLIGTLPVANGGTGQTSTPASGQLLTGNGTNFQLVTAPSTTGYILQAQPVSGGVAWAQLALNGTGVTGILPVANGGVFPHASTGSLPASFWSPNATYQTVDPNLLSVSFNAFSPTKGVVYYYAIYLPAGTSPSKIVYNIQTAGTSATCLAGLYNSTTQIGYTGTGPTTVGSTSLTLTATSAGSLTSLAGGVYFIGFLIINTSTTSPSVLATTTYGVQAVSSNFGPALTAGTLTTQTSKLGTGLNALPASISGTPTTAPGGLQWLGLS